MTADQSAKHFTLCYTVYKLRIPKSRSIEPRVQEHLIYLAELHFIKIPFTGAAAFGCSTRVQWLGQIATLEMEEIESERVRARFSRETRRARWQRARPCPRTTSRRDHCPYQGPSEPGRCKANYSAASDVQERLGIPRG